MVGRFIHGRGCIKMKIGSYTLRRPWVKYVNLELDLDQQMTRAIIKAIKSNIVADIISLDLCDVECDVIHYLEKTVRA
jgi:hypothetical protein